MNEEINLDHLFSPSVSKEDTEYGDAFKKVALLHYFGDMDLIDYPDEQKESVIKNSSLFNEKIRMLNENVRNDVLKEMIENNELEDTAKRLNIDSELSQILTKITSNPKLNYSELSINELFYLISLLPLYSNRFDGEKLKSELNKKYFINQFEKITRNFAGRHAELAALNDYVNWLPSRTFLGKIANTFRNIINWQEKPPLIIQGVGGIGKSTILSKFILEQNIEKDGKTLPFVYIDFDLPGFNIKEPLSILTESLRQLSIQFYPYKYIFDDIVNRISLVVEKNNSDIGQNFQYYNSSVSSTRSALFHDLQYLIKDYSFKLDELDIPVLIVFDSFEEMQFRSSREEMNNFLGFIKELSEKLPRIRPVFSGRAELEDQLDNFSFQFLRVQDFDKESAIALLLKNSIDPVQIAEQIYEIFGGTPLMLHLAMNMVKKDPESLADFTKIKNQKHEYLVQRILEHIHDIEVQKIAVPGMLIRRINTEIIKEVLAKPCGLNESENAELIFESLKKETMLVSKSSATDEIIFRTDLRMACVPLIREKYIISSRQIEANIINYYKKRIEKGVLYEAEYYFHVLKKGSIPSTLTTAVYNRIKDYIGYSFQEFPRNVQIYWHSLAKTKVSNGLISAMSDEEWETYYMMLLKTGLNGDLAYLNILNDEIEQGKDRFRLSFSEFIIYHTLLHQRLGKFDSSNNMIDKFISGKIPPLSIIGQLSFIKAQNREYLNAYEEAKVLLENIIQEDYKLPDIIEKSVKMQYERVLSRFNSYQRLSHISEDNLATEMSENMSYNNTFNENEFQYTNWNFLLANALPNHNFFRTAEKFYEQEKQLIIFIEQKKVSSNPEAQNFDKLEMICNHLLGIYTQSLSLTGVYEVVIRDFLYALEVRNMELDMNKLNELFEQS